MKTEENIAQREGPGWTEAYPILSAVINERGLRVGAELGVAYGGHAEYILAHTQVERLYGIDPYRHIFGYSDPMNFSNKIFDAVYKNTQERLSPFGGRFIPIRKKSKDALSDVPETLDFIYIDADHSYKGVRDDIARWYDKVRPGGIIAGHDYDHPNFPGVKNAVDEFCAKHNWKVHSDKSGVWWVEKEVRSVSFIIPAFNCEDTIEEAVSSILASNFQHGDEIVIVNDGSTDATLLKITRLEKKHAGIRVINHEKNLGGGAARNTAVKHSSHELIFCLDSDNVLEKNSIQKLKSFLIETRSDVASFSSLYFFNTTPVTVAHKWLFKKEIISFSDVFYSFIIPPSSGNYLYTKESWRIAGGYPEEAGALDAWGFGVRQLATGAKMSVLRDSYYFHRFGNESYWMRESHKGTLSQNALAIISPYRDQIQKDIISYIETHPDTWFSDIGTIVTPSATIGVIRVPFGKTLLPRIKKALPSFIKNPIKKISLYLSFVSDYRAFVASDHTHRFPMTWKNRYPQLHDKTAGTEFDTHYLYHPAWAARIIAKNNPSKHIDISSILHFSTLVSAFVPVEFYDYRPAAITLGGLTCGSADLTALHFTDNSIESLSCMHTIEHIGLGRYGDPIDPDGDLKAMKELVRVLAPGGTLLFVTPIGKPRIQFNAHRIYSYEQITNYFSDLKLEEFSLIPDNGLQTGIVKDASETLADAQKYGCGCFWFKKI